MPPRPSRQSRSPREPGRLATAWVAGTALVLVAAALVRAPGIIGLLPALGVQALHLLAAFSAGLALTGFARAAPKGALGIIVTALTLGLAFLSLLTLGIAMAGLTNAWTPWAVDLAALLLGVTRLPQAIERVRDPMRRQEHALLVGFRVPLFAALSMLVLLHVLPAFLPVEPATGAGALALPSQATIRADLRDALAALPDAAATPSQALLLHGHLATGAVGARLHATCLVLLLAAAVFLAGLRRFGARVAAWAAVILLSVPWLFERLARDPSAALVALLAFLAWRDISEWLIDGTGGKIALASACGGVMIAESAAGATAFAVLLAMLLVMEALVEREGVGRALAGVAAMAGLALAVALPFVLLAVALHPEPLAALATRWVSGPIATHVAHLTHAVPGAELDELAGRAAAAALALGPLLIGLLALVPLVTAPPAPLRHAVLAVLLGVVACLAPPPFAPPVALAGPAALAAAVAGVAAVSRRGVVGGLARTFAFLGLSGSGLLLLLSGPDLGQGLSVLIGRQPPGSYLENRLPDADLIVDIASREIPPEKSVLLVGAMSDACHAVRVRRVSEPATEQALREALDPQRGDVLLVAWDRAHASPAELAVLGELQVLARHGDRVLLEAPRRR